MVRFARYSIVLAGLLVLSAAGCRESSTPERFPRKSDADAKSGERPFNHSGEESDNPPVVQPEEPPPPPTIPKVVMSDELRATCLVNVDDTIPEAELADLDGKPSELGSLFGPKLTVLCFWTIGTTPRSQLVANAVLQDLMKDVVGPFGEQGVRVVAINVGDGVEDVKKYVADAKATFPNLLDPQGEYFTKIATERKMPRTYLLDAEGKVLWFDMEYSNTARRDLVQGIEVALDEMK
ncbi:MAG: TlpA family protein disulfide reductase [Planctomycetes bacterium]|nr:TlpA family protein disulfide reductase [Planctomycetota bacterium]MBU4399926.1 TlpA family protein disulfide reductase [Planctomycetota bacterium]MCG2683911.1 TlpA family protein disulfide reductase [Planctomycetales bacterium]